MFDAITLAAVADELNGTIVHGRVQEIVQLDAFSFGLEVYAQPARRYLYITVSPDDARVHLVAQKLRGSGEPPSSFLLLLRKYAQDAFVDAILPLSNERVLKIQFDHATEGISTLVVETIGKYSNLILVDAGGVVIDALKRVTGAVNRARVVLPKHAYDPPPPQSKLSPSQIDASDLARVLAQNRGVPLWQVLVRSVAGVSPLFAREIAFRVGGSAHAPSDPLSAREILSTLWQVGNLRPDTFRKTPLCEPTVAFEGDEPSAFAPYPLTQFAVTRPYASVSAAIEAFYGAPDSYAAAKEPLRTALERAREKCERKRAALAQSLPQADEVERLKTNGELILAYASQIKEKQRTLEAETAAGMVEIPLDLRLTPVENAQKYFKDYHRAKDAAARVPALLAAAGREVEYADQMLSDLEFASSRAEIEAVVSAAREAGLVTIGRPRAKTAAVSEPRRYPSRDGFAILVGKNARQNEEVTFRLARPDDLWLHARNAAGAHVVILCAGREVPESTVEEAAGLAAYYSQAHSDTRVEVIVTSRKNVRRVRGGRMGMVTVQGERVITVHPADRVS